MSSSGLGRLFGRPARPQVRYQASDQSLGVREKVALHLNDYPAGGLPPRVQIFSGEWQIRQETDAPAAPKVLWQVGQARFPAVALTETVYGDVDVSVRFKPIAGRQDQAGGIIFRVQDKDNYYILRANALENNVNFYKYVAGQRLPLRRANAPVRAGVWQELRVEIVANRMRGYFNGELLVVANDDAFPAGRIGLWTKADSITCFDDVVITPL